MKGGVVNGYSVFELPADELGVTNGNMWRAGLEMAVQGAIRDGFSLVQVKVNGRKGWQVENPPGGVGTVIVTKKMKLDEGGNVVDANKPAIPKGAAVVANGDAKPETEDKKPVKAEPHLPIEMD